MGVDIGDLFTKNKITFSDLKDRVIAIDAHNALHQFLSSIRQIDGTPLKNSKGEITSHLSGLLYRNANMIEAKIKPVYVFDGVPHPLKKKTIEKRKERKLKAEEEWKKALEAGDLVKAKQKAMQTSRVTDEIVKQSKELLKLLGIPFVQAPEEGEAQASYMVKKGVAYAAGSQDFDCLLVGAPVLVQNLTSSTRRKLPGKKTYTRITPLQIRLQENLKKMGITQKQLVDMAILIGTDFNEGIKGIGPKTSLKLIKKTGNAENAIATIGDKNAPTFEEIKEIRKIFLKPKITDDFTLTWRPPDEEKVKKFLCDKYQFSEERVEKTLKKFSNIENILKQKTLF